MRSAVPCISIARKAVLISSLILLHGDKHGLSCRIYQQPRRMPRDTSRETRGSRGGYSAYEGRNCSRPTVMSSDVPRLIRGAEVLAGGFPLPPGWRATSHRQERECLSY